MEMLSEKYGWTPSQIRGEDVKDLMIYIDIISVKNRIEKENNKNYGRK